MITVKNLTKNYGKDDAVVHALSECSIMFEHGKFTAIIGTSGSGKSTLLHLAAGLDSADTGSFTTAQTFFRLKTRNYRGSGSKTSESFFSSSI